MMEILMVAVLVFLAGFIPGGIAPYLGYRVSEKELSEGKKDAAVFSVKKMASAILFYSFITSFFGTYIAIRAYLLTQ